MHLAPLAACLSASNTGDCAARRSSGQAADAASIAMQDWVKDALQRLGQQAKCLVIVEEAHERQRQQHRHKARQQHDSACASLKRWHHKTPSSSFLLVKQDGRADRVTTAQRLQWAAARAHPG